MKIVLFTLYLVMIFCCFINSIDAVVERQKRWAGREICPEHKTHQECLEYAKQKSKKFNDCNGFTVGRIFHDIEWKSCANIHCEGNSRLVAVDLSKLYPKCCEHRVDDS
ncbi:uncharacterized protein LOC131668386 [Phymastichus coffea]|uniref:uncharacterized protein LOC131668386 n=1 Tax=Phymastichus coffea TaxID=108790 RepID=UPI00273C8D4F|nr:uncharacterized protein LOC131668386 [Phymastichus coffea]